MLWLLNHIHYTRHSPPRRVALIWILLCLGRPVFQKTIQEPMIQCYQNAIRVANYVSDCSWLDPSNHATITTASTNIIATYVIINLTKYFKVGLLSLTHHLTYFHWAVMLYCLLLYGIAVPLPAGPTRSVLTELQSQVHLWHFLTILPNSQNLCNY